MGRSLINWTVSLILSLKIKKTGNKILIAEDNSNFPDWRKCMKQRVKELIS